MTKRFIPINFLRPSDTPKDLVVEFYALLNPEDFSKLIIPEVWLVERELIISDGNNYATFMAYKGIKEIEVDLKNANKYPIFEEEIENTRRDAYILKLFKIKSPYDLVPLINWKNIEQKISSRNYSKVSLVH
jgi:hypothetical protein